MRSLFALGAALIGGAMAQAGGDSGSSPCAIVSRAASSYIENFVTSADQAIYVPADAAEACLKSVPMNKTDNLLLIEEMMYYISWQSNLAYLVNPPKGYTESQVDIIARFEEIYKNLSEDRYDNEWDFMLDVHMTLIQSYDFHLAYLPDIMNIFSFIRGDFYSEEFALISVSSDGQALPELYNYFDLKAATAGGRQASPITQINGKPAEEYVASWAERSAYHDADARYNAMFPNQASISYGFPVNEFQASAFPDGAETIITHKNGSTVSYTNYARLRRSFNGVVDGESLYSRLLNQGRPSRPLKKRDAPLEERQATQTTAIGYPPPTLLHSEAVVGGYYLSGAGLDDVAVLTIPSFSPEGQNGAVEFQEIVRQFFDKAKTAGKTRLVIDLRGNTGGRLFLSYDVFKQLFPSLEPYGATRFRANEAFDVAGIALTEYIKGFTYEDAVEDATQGTHSGELAAAWGSLFNYHLPLTVEGKPFQSWDEMFGPFIFNGDNFTALQRYDLNNVFTDDSDMDISGYGVRSNMLSTEQPFKAENIVLLQDGMCGSACAIFSEFMKSQARVQQIVVGGGPHTGPMQAVAGSKGAQVWSFDRVQREALTAYGVLSDYSDILDGTEIGGLVRADRPLNRAAWSSDGTVMATINLRDNIREGDKSQTPLEFVYEAADCRLFYTVPMLEDVRAIWAATANARWNNSQGCVSGSTGHQTSVSGGVDLPGSEVAASGAPEPSRNAFAAFVAAICVCISVLI